MLCGRTRDRNLDDLEFLPIFEAASALNVPLYLHPQSPRTTVREAYYSGFGNQLDAMFATAGIGWHYEDGIQAPRLVLAGIFDRYPNLQIILGHWGEVVPFFLERIDRMSALGKQVGRLQRPIIEYFQTNFSVTPSGIFSERYLRWSIEVLGVDRILFSTDYPYLIDSAGVSRFFENATPTEEEKVKIAFSNWERMCSAIRR